MAWPGFAPASRVGKERAQSQLGHDLPCASLRVTSVHAPADNA
jgi:hypothetical protein